MRAEGIGVEEGKVDRNRRFVPIYTQSSENVVSVVFDVGNAAVRVGLGY